jgi:hypothetical protein
MILITNRFKNDQFFKDFSFLIRPIIENKKDKSDYMQVIQVVPSVIGVKLSATDGDRLHQVQYPVDMMPVELLMGYYRIISHDKKQIVISKDLDLTDSCYPDLSDIETYSYALKTDSDCVCIDTSSYELSGVAALLFRSMDSGLCVNLDFLKSVMTDAFMGYYNKGCRGPIPFFNETKTLYAMPKFL